VVQPAFVTKHAYACQRAMMLQCYGNRLLVSHWSNATNTLWFIPPKGRSKA